MKYIQKFENIKDDLKLYAVWDNNPHNIDTYEILQTTRKTKINEHIDMIWAKTLYVFTPDTGELRKMYDNEEEHFSSNVISKHIKFTSNDIDECIDYLKIYIDAKNYNL